MKRIDRLLGPDLLSRWRIISFSALTVFLCGLISDRILHNTLREAQIAASILGGLVFIIQTLTYCQNPAHAARSHFKRIQFGYLMRALVATAMIVVAVAISGSSAEAAILN